MQTVDIVIAGVGVVAIIATTLGVVFYDDAVGEEEIMLETYMDEGALTDTKTGNAGSTVLFDFDAPDNSTGAAFDLAISFTGQSGQGSTISFSAELVDPTGNVSTPAGTGTMTIGANANSGSTTVEIPLWTWAERPGDDAIETYTWPEGMQVRLTIGGSNDALASVPGVSYSFSAVATGDVEMYREHVQVVDPGVL